MVLHRHCWTLTEAAVCCTATVGPSPRRLTVMAAAGQLDGDVLRVLHRAAEEAASVASVGKAEGKRTRLPARLRSAQSAHPPRVGE